ncbi:MAR-binding filament-like protein 1-1 [Nicotiana tomentosiformis]|uniref:MAR-binding filament-like protein 1-1 n=1 Tax=Nicotiana tomentosiformis TaxID=4098 RepID=UPI00388CDA5A
MANDPNPQVQKKLDQIEQLQAEVDKVKAEAEEWKKNMNRLASKKETSREQLDSTEVQLRDAKEKTLVQAKKIEELQSQLSSAISSQENLAKELEVAKSEIVVVKAEADERVAQHKVDAEVAQDQVRNLVEHMKWQSRREALEGVRAQGFDLLAEIENANVSEAMARKLAYPKEEDSEGSEDSDDPEGSGDPKGDEAAPDKD